MASDRLFRNLAIPAVRYALGRRTYVVQDVIEAIEYHRDLLTPEERATIRRDIYEADLAGNLGNGRIDAPRWRALRRVLTAPDVFDASLPPGGYVCADCGQPVESEPCPDHQTPADETPKEPTDGAV